MQHSDGELHAALPRTRRGLGVSNPAPATEESSSPKPPAEAAEG